MSEKVTVLVNSCDKYQDLWVPFFTLYKKYWNPQYPIVLNTESLSFSFAGLDISTFEFYKDKTDIPWGERLITTLTAIETDYVIFLLDDFYFNSSVSQAEILKCISYMDHNTSIACFSFLPIGAGSNINDGKYEGFELRPKKCAYKLNCQAALWRRKDLIRYIRPHESPWYFETLGSKRASRYNELVYSRTKDAEPIMQYFYEIGGAVHRGKWNRTVYDFCQKHGISLSESTREVSEYVPGDQNARKNYYINRLKSGNIMKALVARWKSLKW